MGFFSTPILAEELFIEASIYLLPSHMHIDYCTTDKRDPPIQTFSRYTLSFFYPYNPLFSRPFSHYLPRPLGNREITQVGSLNYSQ